jgi:hypothetical protein
VREVRNPKFETRSKLEVRKSKSEGTNASRGAPSFPRPLIGSLRASGFGFVSNFEFRPSNFLSKLLNLFPQGPKISVFQRHLFDFVFALFSANHNGPLEPDASGVELVHLAGITG